MSAVEASRGSFENHCRDASLIIVNDLEQNLCCRFSCHDVKVCLQVTGFSIESCSVQLFGLFESHDVWRAALQGSVIMLFVSVDVELQRIVAAPCFSDSREGRGEV